MRPVAIAYDIGSTSLENLLRALRRRGPVVFVVPANRHVAVVRDALAAVGPVVDLADVPTAARRLRELNVAGIVTFSERMVRATADLAQAAGLDGLLPKTARWLTDKWRQRERLRESGVDTTRSAHLTDPADWPEAVAHTGLPAIVKPVHACESRNAFLVADAETGAALMHRLLTDEPDLVVEEYLRGEDRGRYGDYVSVESITVAGEPHHLAVVGKFPMTAPFRELGNIWPAPLPAAQHAAVLDLTTAALRALSVHTGYTHTEIKLTPHGPRIVEVNGRLGGQVDQLADAMFGFDVIALGIDVATGRREVPSAPVADGVFFQYHNAAPFGATGVLAAFGASAVRRCDGIVEYISFLPRGLTLDGFSKYDLDYLSGRAADHDAMFTVLDSTLRHLVFLFQTPGGTMAINGTDLRRHHRTTPPECAADWTAATPAATM